MPKVIYLYDDIGEYGVSAQSFAREMAAAVGSDIELHICCYGGEVSHGFAIANTVKGHVGKKVAIIDGYCASAATFVAMYCDEIRMHEMSMLMIHRSAGGVFGHADELDDKARALHGIDSIMHATYKAKSGADDATVTGWMAGDMYLTPAQALAAKLCDSIIPGPSPVAAATAKSPKFYAMAGKLPASVRAFLSPPVPIPTPAPAPKAAAPAPTRSQGMDRKQLIGALAASLALSMELMQQASESPDADLQAAATASLAEGVLPCAMNLIMPLARAEGMDETPGQAKTVLAVFEEVQKATGNKGSAGILGDLDALVVAAKSKTSTAQASLDVQVEVEIQKGIKAVKLLPAQAAAYRTAIASGKRTLADLKNFIASALPAGTNASSEETRGAKTGTDDTTSGDPEVAEMLDF